MHLGFILPTFCIVKQLGDKFNKSFKLVYRIILSGNAIMLNVQNRKRREKAYSPGANISKINTDMIINIDLVDIQDCLPFTLLDIDI